MNIYFIDSENVNKDYIDDLELLSRGDRVIVFVSEMSHKLDYWSVSKIIKAKSRFQVVNCLCGAKDALDKQLISYVGFEVRMNKKCNYYIISNDKGFDVLEPFWEQIGRNVKRYDSIRESFNIKAEPVVSTNKGKEASKQSHEDEIKKLCKTHRMKVEKLKNIVTSSCDLGSLHNRLRKTYKEHGTAVYKILRDTYGDISGIKVAVTSRDWREN